jgi:hypothetical protein
MNRREFLEQMVVLSAASAIAPLRANEVADGAAAGGKPVVRENVRFEVLTPTLIRMEYSPTSHFVDAASIAVIKRNWPAARFTTGETDGWLSIKTDKMTLRYKLGAGPFKAGNLRITWHGKGSQHWQPGDKDDKNLLGVPGDMSHQVTPVTTPGPLTANGYFLLDDSRTALRDRETKWVKPRSGKDGQDWYFFVYGHDYAHMLGEFSQLIGPIPMVPRYVLGVWFGSRAGYSSHEWKMIVSHFREDSLPLDMVVLDSDSSAKCIWSGYDWDREQLPHPRAFFHWMRQHGVKVTVNEHYGAITPVSESHFEEIRKDLGLPADTKEISHNLASKKYAGLFMDIMHKPALDDAMAFWWQDGCAGAEMEGLDPMEWTREVEYDGQERITGKRTFIFCRLGAWGSHRYGAYFTGDLPGVWDCLDVIVPAAQQAGNMLVAYINNLCGGVFNVRLPQDLYQRWVQFSALSPIMWFHGFWGQREPWEYGPAGVEAYRKFVSLRYALIPYIYTYGRIAHETGMPLVRGMYLDYPDQEPSYSYNHQYMFGRELLVAPVTKPADDKPATPAGDGAVFSSSPANQPALKEVFLPAGSKWFDYFTGDIYEGGRTITHECPLERMPLFVRSGSILPLAPKMDYSDQKPLDPLTLDIYAGAGAQFDLYEDDGLSLGYHGGEFAWTLITFGPTSEPECYQLVIGPTRGRFEGQLAARRYVVCLHGILKPRAVMLGGKMLAELDQYEGGDGWSWDAQRRVANVHIAHAHCIRTAIALTVQGAGTFADVMVQQQALNLRSQVRQVRRQIKFQWAALLNGGDIDVPPHVLQVADNVDGELSRIVTNPWGAGRHPPDFDALRATLRQALVEHPFESRRTIPEADPERIAMIKRLWNATFTPAQIKLMTGMLLGADVPARGLAQTAWS